MKVSKTQRERAILGQVSDLDLRLLRVFKAVVECGGAPVFHFHQSSLNRQAEKHR